LGFGLSTGRAQDRDFLHRADADAQARSVRVIVEQPQAGIDAQPGRVEPPLQGQGRERADDSLDLAADGHDQAISEGGLPLRRGVSALDFRRRAGVLGSEDQGVQARHWERSATQNWESAGSPPKGMELTSASGTPEERYQA